MSINREAVYDNDYVTLKQVKEIMGETEEENDIKYSHNYGSQPTPPYYVNDTWTDTSGKIYMCVTERLIGDYDPSDWVLIIDKEPYDQIVEEYGDVDVNMLDAQLFDHKIETYVQEEDPAINWITYIDKEPHLYDCWKKGTEEKIYVRHNTNPITYSWENRHGSQLIWNNNTGHKNIFGDIPIDYQAHDLWVISENTPEDYIPDGCNIGDMVAASVGNNVYDKNDWYKVEGTINLTITEPKIYTRFEIDRTNEILMDDVNSKLVQSKSNILAEVSDVYATKVTVQEFDSELGILTTEIDNTKSNVSSLEILSNSIQSTVSSVSSTISSTNNDLQTYKEQNNDIVNNINRLLQDSNSTLLEFIDTINTDGVDKVVTSTGFKLDKTGLHIDQLGAKCSFLADSTGIYVVDSSNNNRLTANNEGVIADNLTARGYLITRPVRGEAVVINGEDRYGHFWMGMEI